MGLGPLHTVSLAEARGKAEVWRVLRRKGLDPLEERSKEQQAKTIEAAAAITSKKCAETYITTHHVEERQAREEWTATLHSCFQESADRGG